MLFQKVARAVTGIIFRSYYHIVFQGVEQVPKKGGFWCAATTAPPWIPFSGSEGEMQPALYGKGGTV
ncbi:MAG: hypothetical protein ACLRVT_05310 [Oscillospiraceae bacterium]